MAQPPPLRPMTLIEPDPDLQWQLHALPPAAEPRGPSAAPPPLPGPIYPTAPTPVDTGPKPYRPSHRPPVPVLTVCDDGSNEGEVVRIRGTQFVIGRTEGDLRLGTDEMVSSRHAEIVCQQVAGSYRWVVADLQSRNGLYLRVRKAILSDGTEFLVGQGRYRFEAPGSPAAPEETVDQVEQPVGRSTTRGWDSGTGDDRPMLTEILPAGVGARIPLAAGEVWIGSDPGCAVCRAGDPFVSPRHAHVFREPKGWAVRNNGTANGLWVRMPQFVVAKECAFQIGEQRFRLSVPA